MALLGQNVFSSRHGEHNSQTELLKAWLTEVTGHGMMCNNQIGHVLLDDHLHAQM